MINSAIPARLTAGTPVGVKGVSKKIWRAYDS